jgi:hypothetical protein
VYVMLNPRTCSLSLSRCEGNDGRLEVRSLDIFLGGANGLFFHGILYRRLAPGTGTE